MSGLRILSAILENREEIEHQHVMAGLKNTPPKHAHTMSGRHKASHMPYNWSEHVPPTTKLSVTTPEPRQSMALMYAVSFSSRPAIMGPTKNGPNLTDDETQNNVNSRVQFETGCVEDKVPFLVKHVGDHVRKHMWFDRSLFPQFVHL